MVFSLADNLDRDLKFLFKQKPWTAVAAQDYSGIRFVAKQRMKKDRVRLLFDGRHLRRNGKNKFVRDTIYYFLLDENFNLLKAKTTPKSIPTNHCLPRNTSDLRLHQLLDLNLDSGVFQTSADCHVGDQMLLADPQDYDSTIAWLEQANPNVNVMIYYCFRLLPAPLRCYWIKRKVTTSEDWIFLDAFTGTNNKLQFRRKVSKKVGRPKLDLNIVTKQEDEEENWADKSEQLTFSDASHKNNRSSGVSVSLKGISQAVTLGLLDDGAASKMIAQLAKAVGVLWMHLDTDQKVRYVSYEDGLGFFECFKICPHLSVYDPQRNTDPYYLVQEEKEDKWYNFNFERRETLAVEDWKCFFDVVFQRREELLKHKAKILNPLIQKIDGDASSGRCKSTVSNCVASLKATLRKTKLVVCCRDDSVLHALKLWLAHYLAQKNEKGFRGLYLRSSGDNEIASLVSSSLDVDNIGHFFGMDTAERSPYRDEGEDILSVCRDWLPASTCHQKNLPFKPIIDDKMSGLENQGVVYSPGKIAGYEKGYKTCLRKRSRVLTRCILALYKEFSQFLFDTYGYDFTLVEHQSVPSVAFKCIWLSFYKAGGPLSQSIEKTKPHYEDALRNFCHGGFSYSCQSRVNSGDFLCPDGDKEKARSMTELDLTSCYGYSMTQLKVPGAFCVGYTLENGHLTRTDKTDRSNSFEYKSCMLVLRRLVQAGCDITSVYSNFSPLGLFYVKKYPADLVVVTRDSWTLIVQFDGRFVHGCPECKLAGTTLKRYANDSTEDSLIEKSKIRDEIFLSWIEVENAKGGQQYSYEVVRDCHTRHFTTRELEVAFRDTPELKRLREPYSTLSRHTIKLKDILNAHKDLTYLLVGSGRVPVAYRHNTPTRNGTILVWKKDREGNNYQDFGWETPEGGALFTRDTLEYLVREHNFELESVSCCYFYRCCEVMPRVFTKLVDERQKCGDNQKSKAKFIKSIVNLGTGMLGYNPHNKMRTSFPRIVNKIKPSCIRDARLFHVGQVKDDMFSVVQTVKARKKVTTAHRKPCNVALPLYISVVEYGKHRLLECLTFLFAHCRPGAVKLCYSQVDCAILALAGDTLEETIDPALLEAFRDQKNNFFTTEGKPGHLKEEWSVSYNDFPNGWKFASPYICCYALISADPDPPDASQLSRPAKKLKIDFDGYAKASSFNCLTTKRHYELACNALDRVSMVVEQERRTNKLLTTATETVSIRVPFATLR